MPHDPYTSTSRRWAAVSAAGVLTLSATLAASLWHNVREYERSWAAATRGTAAVVRVDRPVRGPDVGPTAGGTGPACGTGWGFGPVAAVPWLLISDGDRTWYQRVMWEPWLDRVQGSLWIVGRRVGRGPFVADVVGYGRLWPAGPARPREPRWLEQLTEFRPRERQSRISTLIRVVVPVAALVGLFVLAAGDRFAAWWLVGLVVAGQVWLLILYIGGVPAPVPHWWRWSPTATTRKS